jgi:hypothetical protein
MYRATSQPANETILSDFQNDTDFSSAFGLGLGGDRTH